ncbi:hypothetical protein CHLNCDRAFT_50738 [Chlorella variabilis]|uniref:Methyltransferase type 11 domain-containing protein n=1 Tax=Chlorella variabilis TaxID=554065 RepID=E1Z881_CHLVA|nr:hypothetical protein CHLNCDRAFT_50738 [Chlorella variabilis]EFN58298.1 hypothetical protein CHLNCDRAFT_50738 [Chlorella variabilis]|eukprot:XP_005850400.1 hypothetical protein CHLNCDRAFT_50738 [Chlorella variabilis]
MAAQAAAAGSLQHAAFVSGPPMRRPARRQAPVAAAQASGATNVSGVADKAKPDWTGDDTLSRVVNAAINFKPLFALMKLGARQTMKSTAEKAGVPWSANVRELEQSEVFQIKEEIEDKGLAYPDYYTVPFHGYNEGNLNWLAAFEVEPASDVMALRVWKTEQLTPLQAMTRLRKAIYTAIRAFQARHDLREVRDMIDIGCSVGVSTRWLAAEWPQAQRQRIRYMHANMESTGLPDASFDLVAVQFVAHECPGRAIEGLVRECRRLLRPGGTLALCDNNPRSKVIQNLPPVLFTLMKSTEPHSDEYYQYDIEGCMQAQGLQGVGTVESDPRHRVILGYLPRDQ